MSGAEQGQILALRQTQAAAARIGDDRKQEDALRQIVRTHARAWHRNNPDAFSWLNAEKKQILEAYAVQSDFFQYDQWATWSLPPNIEGEIDPWLWHFNALELRSSKTDSGEDVFVLGHFDGRTALLARWSSSKLSAPNGEEMRGVVECRRRLRTAGKRASAIVGVLCATASTVQMLAIHSILAERQSEAFLLSVLGLALFLATILDILGRPRMLRQKRSRLQKKFPHLAHWI
jgi:hypothetical protein